MCFLKALIKNFGQIGSQRPTVIHFYLPDLLQAPPKKSDIYLWGN